MSGLRRAEREARRAQYELPGFSAGVCLTRLEHAISLIHAYRQRYGTNILIENVVTELSEVRADIITWQAYAQMVTDYDAAHGAVREECE